MITELYTFSPGSYVTAEEWNANFRTLYNLNVLHQESIVDAQDAVAFPDSDLTNVFNMVNNQANSFVIPGNTVNVAPECEYYKKLSSGDTLTINIPASGLDSEVRVLIQVLEETSLRPFVVNFAGGTVTINDYGISKYASGFYYIMIYESNGLAQVKLIWTGV